MEAQVIKSFMVGLGFGVDDVSLSKFNKAIASATLKVGALYGSIKLAAAGIAFGISKISEDFERMGYEYHIIAPAINKALLLRRELLKAYSAAGINISKVVKESLKLNLSLTKTKFAFEAIYKSVASRFFPLLTKQSDLFRQRIYANMPRILNILESFIKFTFKAFEATTILGLRLWSILGRVYEFFVKLDDITSGWSTKILAIIAIWKIFNLSFLASPLGIILSLGAAILALYDDYKTFKEGGQSLIDWNRFIPTIENVNSLLRATHAILQAISDSIGEVILAFYQLYKGDSGGFWDSLRESSEKILPVLNAIYTVLHSITALGRISDFISDKIVSGLIGVSDTNFARPIAPPLGVGGSLSYPQSNQNVNQQTSINITGAPDANATAKAVSGEQNKVNFDLVRNLKGSVRAGGLLGAVRSGGSP